MTTTKDILIAAKKRISDHHRWTKHTWARAACGAPVQSTSADACSWCASGAVCAAATEIYRRNPRFPSTKVEYTTTRAAVDKLSMALPAGWMHVPDFNDFENTKHEDIMKLFDRAIASC